MKNYIFVASVLASSFAFAQGEVDAIKTLDSQSLKATMSVAQTQTHNLIVKFNDRSVHNDLMQTPETKEIMQKVETMSLPAKSARLEHYNLDDVGIRERGLDSLRGIHSLTGIQLKHVRSSALGVDNVVALSSNDVDTVINSLMSTGMFEYVKPVRKLKKNVNVVKPASIPSMGRVVTSALERNLFNDSFYLNESYIDEQHPNAMGAHSLLKASLYAQDNNNLNRAVRVAVIDTGMYPSEDVVWSSEGADFISGGTSSTYFDCATVDETNSGEDVTCAVEDFQDKQRDTDPTDKSWAFNLDQNGNPTGDGTIYLDGHGLQVGSAIAAIRNNSKGIVSSMDANDVELVNVRALFPDGGTDLDVSDAIVWSSGGEVPGMPNISQKVDVINLSLGGFGLSDCNDVGVYLDAIEFARSQNVVIVGAAGNDGQDVDGYAPGECAGVLTVGANNLQGEITNFSNFGEEVEVTFEGDEVYVATINTSIYEDPSNSNFCGIDGSVKTTENCYGIVSGTSFSAPLASATSAMVRMVQSGLDESQIRALVANTAPLYEENTLGQRTQRSALVPNAGLGNAYLAVTTTLDSVELSNLEVKHRYANFNSAVEQNYIDALIANSNRTNICEVYDMAWSAYREEIVGVNYVIYGSNVASGEMTENNSTVLEGQGGTSTSGLINIDGFNRVGVQAVVNGVSGEIAEFDLTQASRPISCS